MASGKKHDQAGWYTTVLFTACWGYLGLGYTTCFCVGNLIGFLWLSPDVDTRSNPVNRWGKLGFIWKPLQWGTKHRGITHVPIIGAIAIIGYLLFAVAALIIGYLIFVVLAFMAGFDLLSSVEPLLMFTLEAALLMLSLGFGVVVIILGIISQHTVHLILDALSSL